MQPGAGSILQTKADCAALQVQDALTRNLARQFGPQSVRVIGVNPAWVKTEAITALASVLQVRPVKHRAQSDVLVHPHAWCMPWFMVWRCCYVAKRGCHSSGCHGGCGCAPLHRLLAFLGVDAQWVRTAFRYAAATTVRPPKVLSACTITTVAAEAGG